MRFFAVFFMAAGMLYGGHFKLIEKKDYKSTWAFTVDKVRIGCQKQLPVVEANYQTYGLTGFSASMVGQDISPIWADDPLIKGLKKNISPFIDMALKMCNN